MTLLILLAGTGTAAISEDGDVSLSDSTIYTAAIADATIYAATVADSTIYSASLSDTEVI